MKYAVSASSGQESHSPTVAGMPNGAPSSRLWDSTVGWHWSASQQATALKSWRWCLNVSDHLPTHTALPYDGVPRIVITALQIPLMMTRTPDKSEVMWLVVACLVLDGLGHLTVLGEWWAATIRDGCWIWWSDERARWCLRFPSFCSLRHYLHAGRMTEPTPLAL